MVLVEIDEVVGRRPDLDEIRRAPRATQRDRPLVEEQIDVDRLERLSRPALLELLDEAHDRRVPVRESLLVGEVGRRLGRRDERDQRE